MRSLATANELVDWFNMVDATYRSELRELNEFNYARFDSKLEQRTAELKAEFKTRIAELETHLTKRMFAIVRKPLTRRRSSPMFYIRARSPRSQFRYANRKPERNSSPAFVFRALKGRLGEGFSRRIIDGRAPPAKSSLTGTMIGYVMLQVNLTFGASSVADSSGHGRLIGHRSIDGTATG